MIGKKHFNKMKIIPALIAKNQKELESRYKKVSKHFDTFQLDIMDGAFVKNKSLIFNFKLSKSKKYEAHLMVKDPLYWIKKNYSKVDIIILHLETMMKKDIPKIIEYVKKKKKKIGIALNPKTEVKRVFPYLKDLDLVLIMTVVPGKYGSKFLPLCLKKVKEIRKINKNIEIEVDGGINPKTIKLAKKSGANRYVVGSYLQKSEDIISAINQLK